MIIDAHTHRVKNKSAKALINFYPYEDVSKIREGDLLSAGIHPWFIHQHNVDDAFLKLEKLCENKIIDAIGECGIDHYVEDIETQKNVFKRHIAFSGRYKLPMVIHSVKTSHLMLEMHKMHAQNFPWIIHGFQGKIETAKQFSKQNIFISFGEKLLEQPQKYKSLLNEVDMDFVLFETDDCKREVIEIYQAAAEMLNLPLPELEKRIENNFNRIFI
ncbi:TatD family deoxyribonuclease [Labilibacter sediminis]|nr:TatD family deoxyribonuclease [Labilibacter sediminis]